jgi:pimeloyl-ACP methyl ester carboxylesterase
MITISRGISGSTPGSMGSAPVGVTRPGRELSVEELEEFHQQLTYGALLSSLRALASSSRLVVGALLTGLSWPIAVASLAVGAILLFVVYRTLGGGLALLEIIIGIFLVGEIANYIKFCRVKAKLSRIRPLRERLAAPTSVEDTFRRCKELVDEVAGWRNAGDETHAARAKSGVLPRQGLGRTPKEWLEGWFQGVPISQIRRGNVLEFFAWAFYSKREPELFEDERKDLDSMIKEADEFFGFGLLDGYNDAVKPIHINFDPIDAWYRPWIMNVCLHLLYKATVQTLALMGFTRFGSTSFAYFHCAAPREPAVLITGGRVQSKVKPLPPVVFIHGLGVGVTPYLPLLRRLKRTRECFVVELLEVTQVGCDEILPPAKVADSIAEMLQAHGHESACFMGHSYGTAVLTWVIRNRRELVTKAVFLDPICFMLAQPDVAFNFLYRAPANLMMTLAVYLVRRELFTGNVLMRHFYWQHNNIWPDELPDECVVVLSGMDNIIDPRLTREYLKVHQTRMKGRAMKLLWLENHFHGGFLLDGAAQAQILKLL